MTHSPSPPYFSGFDPVTPCFQTQFIPEARPLFAKPGVDSDTIVICLHGFTGTPYEVAPAVKEIAKTGIAAAAPLLPGHGYKTRSDQEHYFSRITMDGMLGVARQEIARARQQFNHVGIFGFSMGGAIALSMAAEKRVDVCVVAAPALRLPLKAEILIPLLSWASFTIEAPTREPFYLPVYEFYHSRSLRTLWQLI